MKSKLIHLLLLGISSAILMAACDRQPRKTAELQRINDSMEHPHNYADTFNADRQKWEEFKIEARARLKQNDDSLKSMSAKIDRTNAKVKTEYQQKMTALQTRNIELRSRVDDYKEEGRENWESFKMKFNNDMDTMSQNIKLFFAEHR